MDTDNIDDIPVSVFLIMRSFHVEKSWQDMNENPSDPGCHCVRLWRPEMDIKDNYCYTYADKICKLDPLERNQILPECIKNHCKKYKLS